jgi:ABC-type multidrug transport system ATPase subunit
VQDQWALHANSVLGYVSQETTLPDFLTVRQSLQLFGALCSPRSSSISITNGNIAGMLPAKYLEQQLHSLSGGSRKKAQLLVSCLAKPALLLLDEVTTGVDPIAAQGIVHFLEMERKEREDRRQQGQLLSSHRIDECLALCENILLLVDGNVNLQAPVELFQALAAQYFQVDALLHPSCGMDSFLQQLKRSDIGQPERQLIYSTNFLRLTFAKQHTSLYVVHRQLQAWLQSGLLLQRAALRCMEMEEVLSTLIAGSMSVMSQDNNGKDERGV